MPTRVLLEGPAIEPLLAQVRDEYGPSARIISADKVRIGGLGGFFARQKYELSIEVDDAPRAGGQPDAPRAGGQPDAPAGPNVPAPGLPERPSPVTPDDEASRLRRAAADLIDAMAGPARPVPGAPVDGLLAEAEAEDRIDGTRPAAVEAPATAVEVPATGSLAAPGLPTPRAGLVSTANPGFAEVLAGLRGGLAGEQAVLNGHGFDKPTPNGDRPASAGGATTPDIVVPVTPARMAGVVRAYRPTAVETGDGTADGPPVVRARDRAGTARPPSHDARPVTAAEPVTAPEPVDAPERERASVAEPAGPCAAGLAELGVPDVLTALATDPDAYRAARQALADLPAPPTPPDQPGDILVIAGDLELALPVARNVAAVLHLPPSAIMLVGSSVAGTGLPAARRISGPAEAERRARRLHRDDVPHIVVVDAPLARTDECWVRDICDALAATAVWAVVDATRKAGDVAAQLRAMGEVDALAVRRTGDTADPASPLGLGTPVAVLEDQPATAHVWSALLAERLEPPPRRQPATRRRGARKEADR